MLEWEVYKGLHPDGAKHQVPVSIPCLKVSVYFYVLPLSVLKETVSSFSYTMVCVRFTYFCP